MNNLDLEKKELNWDELSGSSWITFSKEEVKKYKNKINWERYLTMHQNTSSEILEIAHKYFSKEIFNKIAFFNIAEEDFIRKYREKFDWKILIENSSLSEDLLLDCIKEWENIPIEELEKCFRKARKIDLKSKGYETILLYLNIKS